MTPTVPRTVPEPRFVPRQLELAERTARKSCFLFGPRQTGKSFLVRRTLPGARVYDLLDTQTYLALSARPGRLAEELGPKDRLVVLDEIQRLPDLLHEVQRLIEERGIRFLLTGSSPRKLRRGGVNLLGGRARTVLLHPFSAIELGDEFDLDRALDRGLLPPLWTSDDPDADLAAYVGSYLEQEIVAEAATRNVPAFSRFLRVAALCNGTIVNFTSVANDAQVARTTIYEYFAILKDTLVLHELPAWRESVKRKPLASSKFYFFDVGVARALQQRRHAPGTPEYGLAFETWLMHELTCRRSYGAEEPLAYWRSTSGFEVDFILGDHTAIEAKATANVAGRDLRSLRALAEEKLLRRYLCVCLEPRRRTVDGITILPWREFLEELWGGTYR
jgi:predicted AAA+ superfamily ATPase